MITHNRLRRAAFLCFILMQSCLFAQVREIDSLKKLLPAISDRRETALLLASIADLEAGLDDDSALSHGEQILVIGKELNDDVLLGKGYVITGTAKMWVSTPEESQHDLNLALKYGALTSNDEILGDAYHNIGNVFRLQGQWDSAYHYFEIALKYRMETNDPKRIGASLSSLGAYNYHIGNLQKSLEYYYQALPYREQSNDIRGLATLYTNIALVHIDRKEKTLAVSANSKAMAYNTILGNESRLASNENNYGIIYINELEYDSAIYWYTQSLNRRIRLKDTAGIGECYNNIGNVYNLKGDHVKALESYRYSLKYIEYSNEWHINAALCNFAVSAAHCGLIDTARIALRSAREIVTQMGNLPDMRLSWHGAQSDFYNVIGKYDSALIHYKLYDGLEDSLYKSETGKQLNEIEAKYESTKKQNAIDELTAVQKQKDLQILAAMIGIGLLIVLAGFVIYGSRQRKKTNKLLEIQNTEISVKNKDITDSIIYARRIQQSVLPDKEVLISSVNQAFVLYMPRDIVSGDFYWFRKEGSRLYIACADCTGHGVPGALVSVIGVNLLEQIVAAQPSIPTGELLDQLHRMMHMALRKDSLSSEATDGMDIAILCIDQNSIEFSGAARPLLHYDGKTLNQVKGDRFSIGGVKEQDSEVKFSTHKFPVRRGDTYYMFTDGYADQFGGAKGKKFMSSKFFELVQSQMAGNLVDQETSIAQTFSSWKGSLEQVDDVLVIGIRI